MVLNANHNNLRSLPYRFGDMYPRIHQQPEVNNFDVLEKGDFP